MALYDLPFFPVAGSTGDTGSAGKDGISPTVTVTDISGGHRLTIVDTLGTKTFDIMDGVEGPQGIKGDTGPAGPKGDQGIQGVQGEKGDTGPTGPTGPAGKDGTNGIDGKDGVGIKSVSINNAGELVVVYTNSDTEINLGKVVGVQGPQGEPGPKGETGDTGPQGPAYTLTEEDKTEIVNAVLAKISEQA